MPLDPRWKFPQGKSPEHLYDALYQLIRELRKGEKAVANFLQFPADQIPSDDPNALDDYEEGTWQPTLTFATPGDLAVTYASRLGAYTKIGRLVHVAFNVATSAFTHTTAANALQITGLPFTSAGGFTRSGTLSWGGITKANYTQVVPRLPSAAVIMSFTASGSAQAPSAVTAADMPTGGAVVLSGDLLYEA